MPRKQLHTRILTPTLGRLTRSLAAPHQTQPQVGVKILVCRCFLSNKLLGAALWFIRHNVWAFYSPDELYTNINSEYFCLPPIQLKPKSF